MAIDPITMLLIVREWHAQERRDLLADFCDRDVVTGRPILATLDPLMADVVAAEDRLLAQIDETLIAAGIDPQPQETNVVVLPARGVLPIRLVPRDPWTGGTAA